MSAHVVVSTTPATSARAAGEQLHALLASAQRRFGTGTAALSGGSAALGPLAAMARATVSAVDPTRLDLWWADERHVPLDHPDRNDTAALAALGDLRPPPQRLHRVAGTEMPLAEAAADYDRGFAAWVQQCRRDGRPALDVALLGVGPDGHVASLFPGRAEADAPALAVPVAASPKPPAERVSLTLSALAVADEVWLLATGSAKAAAVATALAGGSRLPAARVRGRRATRWFLDADAAAELPAERRRPG